MFAKPKKPLNPKHTDSSNLGSPSTSLEAVGTPSGQQGIVSCAPRQWVDSEDEAGKLEADWSSHVSADILHTLSDTEKRRQEIINGKHLFEIFFLNPLFNLFLLHIDFLCFFHQKFTKRNAIMYEHCDYWKEFLCDPYRNRRY